MKRILHVLMSVCFMMLILTACGENSSEFTKEDENTLTMTDYDENSSNLTEDNEINIDISTMTDYDENSSEFTDDNENALCIASNYQHFCNVESANGENLSSFNNGYAFIYLTPKNKTPILKDTVACIDTSGNIRFIVKVSDAIFYEPGMDSYRKNNNKVAILSKVENEYVNVCIKDDEYNQKYMVLDLNGNITYSICGGEQENGEVASLLACGGGYTVVSFSREGFDSVSNIVRIIDAYGNVVCEIDCSDYHAGVNSQYLGNNIFSITSRYEDAIFINASSGKEINPSMPEENGMIIANDQEIVRNGKRYRTCISDNDVKELYYGDAIISGNYIDSIYMFRDNEQTLWICNEITGEQFTFEQFEGKIKQVYLASDGTMMLLLNGADDNQYYCISDAHGNIIKDVTIYPVDKYTDEYEILGFDSNAIVFISKNSIVRDQIYVSLKDDYEVTLNNKSYGSLYNDGWALYEEENKGTNYISPNGELLFSYENMSASGLNGAVLNIDGIAITELNGYNQENT